MTKCEHEWEFHSYDQCAQHYQCELCGASKTEITIVEDEEEDEEC